MIYLVVGHPRSGTSMMMRAMEAGGLRAARSDHRERFNVVDGPYQANKGGLYEVPVIEMWKPGWARQYDGCALKMLVQWIRHLPVHEYRAVFMLRDLEETRQSYEAAFGEQSTTELIHVEILEAQLTLRNRRDVCDVRCLRYTEVLANPVGSLQSLGWPIDVDAASRIVDPGQYRFRRERLVEGL